MTEDSSKRRGKYVLYIDDNFHFMDESERIRHSEYDTLEEAIDAAKAIVDSWLLENWSPDITADQFYEIYCGYGDDPWIGGADLSGLVFHAWRYARQRCDELCAKKE